jgi:flagellar biosynthesis protein FliP
MTIEQLTFIVEKSGIPAATLWVLLVFGLILSPLPRFLLVLGAVRIGLRGFPAAVICFGLAFVLSYLQLSPLMENIGEKLTELSPNGGALSPEKSDEFLNHVQTQWRGYIVTHTNPEMKTRVVNILSTAQAEGSSVLVASFFLGELEQAMKISLALLLPLLVIDLLCATIISALGVESLSAEMVSFPLKIALILSTSGWTLIGENLLRSYG